MNRLVLKQRAKDVLRRDYFQAFLVTTVITVLTGGISVASGSAQSAFGHTSSVENDIVETIGFTQPAAAETALFAAFSVVAVISVLLMAAYSVFFSSPLSVGRTRFFLEMRKENTDYKNVLFPFTCGGYKNLTVALLIKNLIVALWSLLIIPGIWFGYAYSLVPYLLAENPELGYRKALDLSKRITDGHKFEIFVLELSFFGWYLLGALVIFGVLFVHPYKEATMAEMYIELRDNAVSKGIINYAEIAAAENAAPNEKPTDETED